MDLLLAVAIFLSGAVALITLLVVLIGLPERKRRAKTIKLERELIDAAINNALKRRGE